MRAGAILAGVGLVVAVNLDDPATRDYLGNPAPLSLADKPGLPTSGFPAAAGAGPSAPAGAGVATSSTLRPASAASVSEPTAKAGVVGSSPSGDTSTPGGFLDIPISEAGGVSSQDGPGSSLLQRLLGQGGKIADLARQLQKLGLFDDAGTFDRGSSEGAFQAQRAGERADLGATEELPDFKFGDLNELSQSFSGFEAAGGAGASALSFGDLSKLSEQFGGFEAAGGAGTAAAGTPGLLATAGEVAPIVDAAFDVKNFIDAIGRGDYAAAGAEVAGAGIGFAAGGPVGAVAGAAIGSALSGIVESFFDIGPSKAWLNFPNELGKTLSLTESSNQKLALDLANASDETAIAKAIGDWKAAIGGRVGGFGSGSGAFDLPDEPGASGTKHEGGISADFSPELAGLRAELASARGGAPIGERVQSFRSAALGSMTPTQLLQIDPTGGLLTPQQKSEWSGRLIEATAQSHPMIAEAIRDGSLSPVEAQGVLDALSPGLTSFVPPPNADLLQRYAPPPDVVAPPYIAQGLEGPIQAGG